MEYSNFIEFDKNKIKKNDAILENYHKLIKFLDIIKEKVKEKIKDNKIDLKFHIKKIRNDNN